MDYRKLGGAKIVSPSTKKDSRKRGQRGGFKIVDY